MNPSHRRFLFLVAILGWVASLVLHIMGWYHIDPGFSMKTITAIDLGAYAVFFAVLFNYRQRFRSSPNGERVNRGVV